jgi:MOSC domain-containing protein YiiM
LGIDSEGIMKHQAEVVSIHAGPIREYRDDRGRLWRSAIAKEALTATIFLGRDGLEGDQVGDPRHHGGCHQAVLAYPVHHYARWKAELGIEAGPGGFGENLAVKGLTEEDVCIGDTFALGQAVIQVSQPREPCHTLEKRWACRGLVDAVFKTARGGWYLRVMQEGEIQAGQPLSLIQRLHPDWTVARVFRAYHGTSAQERLMAAALESLTPKWKEKLAAKA